MYSLAYMLGNRRIVFQFPQEPLYFYCVPQTSKIVSGPYAFFNLLGTGSTFFGKCGLDMNLKNHFRTLPMIKIREFALLLLSSSFLARCRIYKRAVYILHVYIFMQTMLLQNYNIVSLVCISSGSSEISAQTFQLNVKMRRNIREYNKEEG